MMVMYSRFVRSMYLALCALVAMPSATFCSWQRVADFARKHAGKAIIFSIGAAQHALSKIPEEVLYVDSQTSEECEATNKFPRVMARIEDMCAEAGVRPPIRFTHGDYGVFFVSRLPKYSSPERINAIYIPYERAAIWERTYEPNTAVYEEVNVPQDVGSQSFVFVKKLPIEDMRTYFEGSLRHELVHVIEKHNNRLRDIGCTLPFVTTALYSAIGRYIPNMHWLLRPAIAIPQGLLSITATSILFSQFKQHLEQRADYGFPPTSDMKSAMYYKFEKCGKASERDQGIGAVVERLFSTHPSGVQRLAAFEKRYEKAAKERVAVYHDAYKSTHAAIKI